ncbi:hypothetical protein GF345_05085 [Candidatus Woesearchaeota archaeon]|nr:hypothetical protein [Candidatus Woesearchaeota archaeon]
MKKAVILILVLAMMVIGISGCKQDNGTGVVIPSEPSDGADSGTTDDTGTDDDADDSDDTSDDTGDTAPPGEKTKIDLTVSDSYFSPAFPDEGEDVTFKIIFKNQGTEDSGRFDYQVKLYKDSSVWKTDTYSTDSGLKRGEEEKIETMYVFSDSGTYYAEIFVDPDNEIPELIETNNYKRTKSDAVVSSPSD